MSVKICCDLEGPIIRTFQIFGPGPLAYWPRVGTLNPKKVLIRGPSPIPKTSPTNFRQWILLVEFRSFNAPHFSPPSVFVQRSISSPDERTQICHDHLDDSITAKYYPRCASLITIGQSSRPTGDPTAHIPYVRFREHKRGWREIKESKYAFSSHYGWIIMDDKSCIRELEVRVDRGEMKICYGWKMG